MGSHSSLNISSRIMKVILASTVLLFAVFWTKNVDAQRVSFGQSKIDVEKKITTGTRAASTYQNCNCQCNSDTWTDGQYIRGNCRSKDRNGALFCYVSGSALCACRDVQKSSFLKGNDGRFKYYSYEACTTPPRHKCNNYGIGNFRDGDLTFRYCTTSQSSGFGSGNYGNNRPNYGNNRPNYGNNRPNYGSGSNGGFSNNKPNYGSGSNYGNTWRGSGSNSGKYTNGNSQTLDAILNGGGIRSGNSNKNSGSSDGFSQSSSAISF